MKAITHPGKAHDDDILTAAYLIQENGVTEIQRRDPTPKELADPNIIVFDVGGSCDVMKSNFDHHGFNRDAPPICSLSLMLKANGDYEDWDIVFPWLKGIEIVDSKGPFVASALLGLKTSDMEKYLFNPYSTFMSDMFASKTTHLAGEPFFELLRSLGENMSSRIKTIRDRWAIFDNTVVMHSIHHMTVAVFEIVGTIGIESWIKKNNHSVDCVVTRDDRGPGLALYRRYDNRLIDFSRCQGMENLIFAHKNGFNAKISDFDWESTFSRAVSEP